MFYTIQKDVTAELVEKKSKFIANLIAVENQEDAELKIKAVKKKYYDAKHNCFAYVTLDKEQNKVERYSDDGEPTRNSRSTNIRAT
jgi:putative IMPACT (imprinted ancient) family translation regulator